MGPDAAAGRVDVRARTAPSTTRRSTGRHPRPTVVLKEARFPSSVRLRARTRLAALGRSVRDDVARERSDANGHFRLVVVGAREHRLELLHLDLAGQLLDEAGDLL